MEPTNCGMDGGGGSGPITAPGYPQSPQEAARIIEATRVAVRNALIDKPKCFDLLNPFKSRVPGDFNPITVLDTVPVKFVNDGTFDLGFAPGDGVDGRIDILPGFFTISFNPAFIDRGFIDLSRYFNLPFVELSIADMRLVAMLHELGHLTGVNRHPGAEEPSLELRANHDFNAQIYVNCLPQGARYQQ